MNLGIIIGVSEYKNASDLPGCVNDVQAINQLLEMSDKCDDVLLITESGSTRSKPLKSKLSAFVDKYSVEDVEELIFYFTGHGLFEDDEFYYVLTDYESSKKNQTCLSNGELDNLLRNLSANLTIKIVDACQSGTRHVKDPESFQKYLDRSEKSFNNCYFYYSSQNDQSSYQSNEISDFTAAFLAAFIDRNDQEIRYKDILDSLADTFSSNAKQTPFFVMQGSYTEVFGFISSDISSAIRDIITSEVMAESKQFNDPKSLLQLIEEESVDYCSEDEAIECVKLLRKIATTFQFEDQICQLYECKVELQSDSGIPIYTDYLGKYLSKNETNYFARIEKEARNREVPRSAALAGFIAATSILGEDIPMKTESYMAITGASSTVELPFDHIFMRLESRYPNIDDTGCLIFPFLSQTKIAILASFFRYKSREWGVKQIVQSSCEWSGYEVYIKDKTEVEKNIRELLDGYAEYTLHPILDKFDYNDERVS
ncbi:caspase family protein [Halomonas heilongjiangensis]|uniref:Peptidase C14 caspase domain-containing protein n=1 Tax=Halomonas heilongjiangensis TaxID=1387883 RepID=A0A2N7TM10_9GAMM|nr:caspase family protein [Halomonas heilongjiangensis]PMR69226.1 hypothetical protein C1H66_11640 [Halomonas heilongjiangensis]PXX87418.1 hypothetical protein CR158_18800 [Halomonas heilongjiangensis]